MRPKGGAGWQLGACCLGLLVLGAVMMWTTRPGEAKGKERATLQGHRQEVRSLAFSPDGKTLASGNSTIGPAARVTLWDVATGKERAALNKENRGSWVAYSPDGKTLAVPGLLATQVHLLDVTTGKVRVTLEHRDGFEVNSVAFSPDGKTLVSAGLGVMLWDVATGKELATLEGHRGLDTCVAYSPDGKTLASAGRDKAIKLWGVATGK